MNKVACKYVVQESVIAYAALETICLLTEHKCNLADSVINSYNLDDDTLYEVIDESNSEEHKNSRDAFICRLLCESLLRLTMRQRQFVFSYYDNTEDSGYDDFCKLVDYTCELGDQCNCCAECKYKKLLNEFCAEQECMEYTGNNGLYIENRWPVFDVLDNEDYSCEKEKFFYKVTYTLNEIKRDVKDNINTAPFTPFGSKEKKYELLNDHFNMYYKERFEIISRNVLKYFEKIGNDEEITNEKIENLINYLHKQLMSEERARYLNHCNNNTDDGLILPIDEDVKSAVHIMCFTVLKNKLQNLMEVE